VVDNQTHFHQQDLFMGGERGYHTYRIPALVATTAGTLLAFCEGRRHGPGDSGDINLLMRRSADGGATWSAQRVLWDDGEHTCGNPCPVVDRDTGAVWLLLTHNLGEDCERDIIAGESRGTRTVWAARSDDDGLTWTAPIEITATTKRPDWTWYATGPGAGIQTRAGRLVIPCDHIAAGSKAAGSHIVFSDDHGATWQLGGAVTGGAVNECEVVELADGALLLNMRSHDRARKCRMMATSRDGGLTWSAARPDPALVDPICQASIRRYSDSAAGERSRILFTNPADADRRANLTVRLSDDECVSWPVARQLYAGPAAYSCLAVLPDRTIACLYECGEARLSERITLARFPLDWLTGDLDGATTA
jgi:sialidase-1